MENKMTSEQIRASIKVNEETYKQASGTLREILDEKEPRRPYYLERLIGSLNLCADICRHRAKLEFELQKAIQAGKQPRLFYWLILGDLAAFPAKVDQRTIRRPKCP